MKTINQKSQLATKIALLRNKQATDFLHLKDQYHITIDSFRPINLIKNSIGDAITSPNLKANLINGTVGLGINFLTKSLLNHQNKTVLSNVVKFIVNRFTGRKR